MRLLSLMFIAIFLVGCPNTNRQEPSALVVSNETARDLLSKHCLLSEIKTWNVTKEPPQFDKATFLPIPQPSDIISDGPRYYIFWVEGRDYFWIMVSFGFTGQIEWRGPVSLIRDGTIVSRWENTNITNPLVSQ